jgi:hypothetical protein
MTLAKKERSGPSQGFPQGNLRQHRFGEDAVESMVDWISDHVEPDTEPTILDGESDSSA